MPHLLLHRLRLRQQPAVMPLALLERSPGGLALGVLGFVGGTMVLAPYLPYASFQARGDARELLLGRVRAAT